MAKFFVLLRCRVTGDEQPEIITDRDWAGVKVQARQIAATLNEASDRADIEHDYYIAQFTRVE